MDGERREGMPPRRLAGSAALAGTEVEAVRTGGEARGHLLVPGAVRGMVARWWPGHAKSPDTQLKSSTSRIRSI